MNKLNINKIDHSFDKEKFINECIIEWNLDIEFRYLSCFNNTKLLRDYISIICKKFDLSSRDTWRFILVTDEMNNNAIEYWSNSSDDNYIRIKMKKKENIVSICIEVEDAWTWKHHKTAEDMEKIRNKKLKTWFIKYHSIRWRGLFMIIVNIVNNLYFLDSESWWLIVWVEKEITLTT